MSCQKEIEPIPKAEANPEFRYRQERIAHWDNIARGLDRERSWGDYYHQRLIEIYQYLVAPGQRVLEIGCGTGDLLSALKPSVGVGVDFSEEMIRRARQKHPELRLIHADAHDLKLEEQFDIIILSDVLNDLWDLQVVFERLASLSGPGTRIIINSYSRLWELPLALVKRLGMAKPTLYQNWLTVDDIANLLSLVDFEVIRHRVEILWPLKTPVLSNLCNRYLAKLWPFKHLALTHFIVARLRQSLEPSVKEPLVSVIIPARNEAGNISQIFERTPQMGRGTELVFVEGHSQDDTYSAIEQAIETHPEWQCQLLRQTGAGKGDAVRLGFAEARGEVLMILDADLTVPPEDLPRFYQVLRSGKGEFVNGVRLVYPMEKEAMSFFNLLGNKFFSMAFSWLLEQKIKDTLCGTKVLWKHHYNMIVANRDYFGDFDPFGDFDLLFGAAKLNLKIVEMPIRYRERSYGATNISRWNHGWLLLKMVFFASRRIKFV
ncbi:MAG: glycosyltransferase [Thermodesulfobacteriota bacterium]